MPPDAPREWHDDDGDVLDAVMRRAMSGAPECLPAVCPLCDSLSLHAYIHAREGWRAGGSWVWCGACRAFSHARSLTPVGWVNLDAVDEAALTAVPGVLDAMASRIDAHWNAFRAVLLQG